jgi:hypothetical protein
VATVAEQFVEVLARAGVQRVYGVVGDSLNAADRVMIMAGAGCRNAHDDVMALAEVLGAPVGHALRGKEFIQYDNPFDVGMSGLLGYGACHEAMQGADLVLLLGIDFPYDAFLPQARTAHVDIDPTQLGRRTPLELGGGRRRRRDRPRGAAEADPQDRPGVPARHAAPPRAVADPGGRRLHARRRAARADPPRVRRRRPRRAGRRGRHRHQRHRHVQRVGRPLHHPERPAPAPGLVQARQIQVDFAAIARGAGLFARRVEKPAEVPDGIREVLAHPGPALLDLVTDPNALSMPPTITADDVRGFALAVGRTVLTGGVGKMLALARSNLRNIPRP